MTAIFGLSCPSDGPFAEPRAVREHLATISPALAACGSHGEGAWADDRVALGARILHDTPEAAHERQPLVSGDGRWALVADARLDNRRELSALFEPLAGRATPDSALILAAWERWGEACCARLLGDFAFAVWDRRERRLFCARDPLGIRPLYTACGPEGAFLFASQLSGLLAVDELTRRLDRVRAAHFLLGLHDDVERTFFAGVRRLPGGCRAAASSPSKLRVRQA